MKTSLERLLLVAVSIVLVLTASNLLLVALLGDGPAWVPTVLAAFNGAVLGAGGSVAAQLVAARASAARAREEWTERSEAEDRAHQRVATDAARASSHESTRTLFEMVTEMHGELQQAKPTINEIYRSDEWEEAHWEKLWPPVRSLEWDRRVLLMVDPLTRDALQKVIRLIDVMPEYSHPSTPGRPVTHIRDLALHATAVGADVLARYLRSEPFSDKWDEWLGEQRRFVDNYDDFIEREAERSYRDALEYESENPPEPSEA